MLSGINTYSQSIENGDINYWILDISYLGQWGWGQGSVFIGFSADTNFLVNMFLLDVDVNMILKFKISVMTSWGF